MALPVNFKDDVLASSMDGKRRYNMITNSDGTVSFEDVTTYSQEGSNFGSAQINNTNGAINTINNNVLDTIEEISANTSGGKFAGALALKNVNNSIGDISEITNPTYPSVGAFLKYCVDNGFLPDVNAIPLVPKMTSDTTPYGEAFGSGLDPNADYHYYYAFDKNDSTHAWLNTPTNAYVGYKFTKSVCAKRVSIKTVNSDGVRIKNFKIQASNNNSTWSDIYTGTYANNTDLQTFELNNKLYYLSYRLLILDNYHGSYNCVVSTLQFYGRESQ